MKTILLDMDGVLTDFVGSALKLFDKPELKITKEDMCEELNVSSPQFWYKIDGAGEEFWSMMPETPECDQYLDMLNKRGLKFIISTSPSLSEYSVTGKIKWLKKKFGSDFNNYMIGKYKYLMASRHAVLIDDFSKNCNKFIAFGGQAILVPQPYNVLRFYSDNKIEHVESMLERYTK